MRVKDFEKQGARNVIEKQGAKSDSDIRKRLKYFIFTSESIYNYGDGRLNIQSLGKSIIELTHLCLFPIYSFWIIGQKIPKKNYNKKPKMYFYYIKL